MKIILEVMPGVTIVNRPPSNALVVDLSNPYEARSTLKALGLDVVELQGRIWLDISGFNGTVSVSNRSVKQ